MSAVKLAFRDFGMRPPPFTDLVLDVEIVNTEKTPIWFVLPLYLDETAQFGRLLASSVEVMEAAGGGRVRIARFLGNGSFQAFRVGPGVGIMVRELPVTLIGEPPQSEMCVPLMSAEGMMIGTQRGEDWLEVDVLAATDADVTYQPGAVIASQDTPGAKPVPVAMSGIQAWAAHVSLASR